MIQKRMLAKYFHIDVNRINNSVYGLIMGVLEMLNPRVLLSETLSAISFSLRSLAVNPTQNYYTRVCTRYDADRSSELCPRIFRPLRS